MCRLCVQGKLQEENNMLHKPSIKRGETDMMIRVPALALSMAMQRMVECERQQAQAKIDALSAELEELRAEVQAAE